MDLASLGGLILGFVLVMFGTIQAGLSPLDILNIPSVFITFGGGAAASIISSPMSRLTNFANYTRFAFSPQQTDVANLIVTLVNFSERARREGLLSLEDDLVNLDEPFLRKGIQLVVDGTDPELVRNILETEMQNIANRHGDGIKFWGDLGFYFPAFGMIGTLIGLVQMLKNLGAGDPGAIGSGMAAALITTLYGSLGSNLVALPIQRKLQLRDGDEQTIKAIMIEGILSIQSGDNPRIVKDKLSSFLAPADRSQLDEVAGGP
ncbi:MAG: motility protein A [Spirochaetales bacterium]|nr:motility protein A [Leptospiraceae bacterium]MCP5483859.1 motility protein A [Spirochaetales bacterium]MCP5486848.1 motility protein A [Spirochaetales bacterium]